MLALAVISVLGYQPAIELRAEVELPSSNIERGDYLGPEACAECHPDKATTWRESLHPRMNTMARPEEVVAPFQGESIGYGGGRARFTRDDGQLVVELESAAGVRRRYRVTRTIGSAYIQEYVGVQLSGPEPPSAPIYRTEIRLPFGYWRRKQRWFHQQYYDSWFGPEYQGDQLALDPYEPDLGSWEPRCPWCHNTYAFDLRLVRSQTREVGNGIERHFWLAGSELGQPQLAAAASGQLPLDDLVTVGISCESCHLGGRAHAQNDEPMTFGPRHPALRVVAGASPPASVRQVKTALCAQCHSAPSPRYPDGGARRNSSEAVDLAAGVCGQAPACIDCHDPHVRGGQTDRARQLAACTGCHQELASEPARARHARHDADQASCLDCHMPRIVQGFSTVIRTHRISRAFEPTMVASGQPNACNLCHLDRPVSWAARAVALYWGREVKAPADARPAGQVWLDSGDPHLVVTAADAYARSPLGSGALGQLLARLDQPIAYYRMRMVFAIEDILGHELSPALYQPTAAPASRRRQAAALPAALSRSATRP
jgi:hypothetical protein